MKGFRFGSVALLDALGFKGIWSRTNPRTVLRRLKTLRREGLRLQGSDRTGALLHEEALDHRVICVSDTIIVAVTLKGSGEPEYPERPVYRAMLSASLIAATLIDSALDGPPPFLFRGCLAAGPLNLDGDFLIGPAIDEAAELFEQSDGPFFWMAPSALRINDAYAETFFDRIEPNLMLRYSVPMKSGTVAQTLAHPYFGLTLPPERFALTRDKVIRAFGDIARPDVEAKRRNALAFLDHVRCVAAAPGHGYVHTLRLARFEDLTFAQKIRALRQHGTEAPSYFDGSVFPKEPAQIPGPKGAD